MTKLLPDDMPDFKNGTEFVYDPATGFFHADDGGAPEHGIKWVRADLAQPPSADCVTQEMYDAGEKVINKAFAKGHQACPEMVYKAMLASAPHNSQKDGGEKIEGLAEAIERSSSVDRYYQLGGDYCEDLVTLEDFMIIRKAAKAYLKGVE